MKVSRTICFQAEVVREFASRNSRELIREVAFLEIAPDRGSAHILEPLYKIEAFCRAETATLIYVDFSDVQGWRSHLPMGEWSRRTSIETVMISPAPIMIDGEPFDPHEHFRAWQERQRKWSAGKAERLAKARSRAGDLNSQGQKLPEIAARLNADNLRSATGRPWTGEMVRKLLLAAKQSS